MSWNQRIEQWIVQYTYNHQKMNRKMLKAQKAAKNLNILFSGRKEKQKAVKKKGGT